MAYKKSTTSARSSVKKEDVPLRSAKQDFEGQVKESSVNSEKKEEAPAPSVNELVGTPKDEGTTHSTGSTSSLQASSGQAGSLEEKTSDASSSSTNRDQGFARDNGEYPRPVRPGYQSRQRDDSRMQETGPTQEVSGFLDIQPEGHGFLRPKFLVSHRDVYISQSQIRRFSLRPGDLVSGIARPPKDTERYFGLLKVEKVNLMDAEESVGRPYFDDLTPVYPKKQIKLATGKKPLSTRIMDLFSPIGFGQRGMVVSPPKAGKTTILKEIASGISQNFPKVHLMAALIGERPEEVTDISQSVKGEVVASNFDEPPENQTKVAEVVLERAKRLVELGVDVVILLDSITRLARAYNLSIEPSGRTLTGGFDPAALWPAKKFFGAARSCQEGGSLTIIGTALVETGSRMDDLIYEEFKGTGNMELHLDRKLADRRVYPAINIERSGTRQEELLMDENTLKKVATVRRMIDMLSPDERTATIVDRLSKTESNEEFMESLGKA